MICDVRRIGRHRDDNTHNNQRSGRPFLPEVRLTACARHAACAEADGCLGGLPCSHRSPAVREVVRKTEAEVTRSRIDGRFDGWSGKTLFRLQNGQVWQQRISGVWRHLEESPEVEIRKNLLGLWEMELINARRQVGVRRIE